MKIDSNGGSDRPVNPVLELLQTEFERRKPGSVDEANRIAAEVSGRYNRTPQEELGGMSPEQVRALTRPDWMEASLTLNDQLSLEDFADAPLLQNARRLLLAVQELGVVKATASGAFNRKLATRMMEEFAISASDRAFILRYNKVLNQDDVPFLRLLRHLLPQAGLLLFRKGEFRLTKRANGLLADTAAGALSAVLFRVLVQKINLAAFDGLPEADQVQHGLGFSLYQFSRRADDWTELNDIAPKLFLPTILPTLPSRPWSDPPVDYARLRVLRPLKYFGLVEYETEDEFKRPGRIRKSSLFDRFIRFKLPPSIE